MSDDTPRNNDGLSEDELWASLEGVVGSERTSKLIDIVEFRMNAEDYEGALPIIDSAVESARDAEIDQVLAKALYIKCTVDKSLDNYADAIQAGLESARIFERYDSVVGLIEAYNEVSVCYELSGELTEALKYVDIAINSAKQTDNTFELGFVYKQKYDVICKLDFPFEDQLEVLSLARQAFRESGLVEYVLQSDEEAARILMDNGDYKAAQNLLQDCFNVAITRKESRAAYFAQQLGTCLRVSSCYREAIEPLTFAYDYAVKHQLTVDIAHAQIELAVCQWYMHEHEKAFETLARARANFDVCGHDGGVLDCDLFRAPWLHMSDRFAEAAALNELLVETLSGFSKFMARARLADNFRLSGKLHEALAAATPEENEEDFSSRSSWFWRESIRARVLIALNRTEEAWEIARDCNNKGLSTAGYETQGFMLELLGDLNESRGVEHAAIHHWTQAIAMYLSANNMEAAKNLSYRLRPDEHTDQIQ